MYSFMIHCNEYAYNVDISNSYHSKYINSIQVTRIIHQNLQSAELLHLQQKKIYREASRANIQPTSEYFSVHKLFILIM